MVIYLFLINLLSLFIFRENYIKKIGNEPLLLMILQNTIDDDDKIGENWCWTISIVKMTKKNKYDDVDNVDDDA